MSSERRRPQNLHIAHDEGDTQPQRSSAAQLEYQRLMVEAKQAFDRLTAQHAMARSARPTPRGIAKTT